VQALEQNYFMYWTDVRHSYLGLPKPPSLNPADQKIDWRNRDRVRTAAAVLVICLRIGYDPPDIIKTEPCAKLECWVDPFILTKDKSMERIGKNLQRQFENLAATPKTRYRLHLDPPIEEAKKFCTTARKTAKNERVLFYYNGHGVPKPTSSGELWLFNKAYTQYIPVSLAEVVAWLGSPTIMVWDCSAAGNIVTKVQEFGIKRDADLAREAANPSPTPPPTGTSGTDTPPLDPRPQIPTIPFRETIQLGACLGHESLPMNPDLPADLFTCCLTSPIEIGLRFFLLRNPLKTNLNIDMLLRIPGKLNDRRTPLGELTWIFTAVTDTIAWNTLPRELFQKLFRHDLVVAALFRGFLLAERIMRFYHCTPISVPALPQTHNHPLWDSWDLAVDMCLAQLPTLLEHEQRWIESLPPQPPTLPDQSPAPLPPGPPLPYVHSTFFAEQLTAFEVWLEQGTVAKRSQPEQLPVVLQVLLSQAHRLKALVLLCRFLDLGPWAVNVALSIGIFAYVLRLLQAPAAELKPVLIYIWARILAVYENCKEDLLKQTYPPTRSVDQAPYTYFVNILVPTAANQPLPLSNVSEHRAMCAFILSVCCRDFKPGQVACLRSHVFEACLVHLHDDDPHLRQWAALCIAMMWDDFEEAKGLGVRSRVHELLCNMLHTDPEPEVRTAVMYSLGTLLGTTGASHPSKKFGRSIACSGPASGLSPAEQMDVELGVAMATLKCSADGSPAVRRELIVLLSSVVNEHRGQLAIAAYRAIIERVERAAESNGAGVEDKGPSILETLNAAVESDEGPSNPAFQATMFSCMYKTVFDLMADPVPDIAELAAKVMDYILEMLFASPLGPAARGALDTASYSVSAARTRQPPIAATVVHDQLQSDLKPNGAISSPSLGGTLSRTASLATAMKSLAQLTTGVLSDPTPPRLLPPSGLRVNGKPSLSPSPTESASSLLQPSASTDSLRYLQSRAGRIPPKPRAPTPTADRTSIDLIIAQLVAGDEERLKSRRSSPAVAGEGTPDQVLPLKGTAFDFFLGYYQSTQMRVSPTSLHFSSGTDVGL
jgi:regulator-associated protein of mTOR